MRASRRVRWLIAALGVAAMVSAAMALTLGGKGTKPGVSPVAKGMWLSLDEILGLPRKGIAWQRLKAAASGDLGVADIANKNSNHDVRTLAAALVYARTGSERYREKAFEAIMSAIGTEAGGTTLALGRNLVSYVIAADLINLPAYDAGSNRRFRQWLDTARSERLEGRTLIDTQELRANNWGTQAGASRAAVDIYLGDTADLTRTAEVFQGWLGDREAYAGFRFLDDRGWQADPASPSGVNPPGATSEGYSIDGALPEEMRRGGSLRFPPKHTLYPWGALGGALVLAELLHRQGYDAWSWESQALRRAAEFLQGLDQQYRGWWAGGDDSWEPWLLNYAYGAAFPAAHGNLPGKNMAWTDWTHQPARKG